MCPTGVLLTFETTEENNTSGVQIYAKTKEALAEFRHQRQQGKVLMDSWHSLDSLFAPLGPLKRRWVPKKNGRSQEYVALVEGCVGIDEPSEGLEFFDGEKWCAKRCLKNVQD